MKLFRLGNMLILLSVHLSEFKFQDFCDLLTYPGASNELIPRLIQTV